MDNRTSDITIRYNSTVHGGAVDYMRDASPPHTTNLTNLVANTKYNITVTAMYSDNSIRSDSITVQTASGTPSSQGKLNLTTVHSTYHNEHTFTCT